MKNPDPRSSTSRIVPPSTSHPAAKVARQSRPLQQIGLIPGLERLVPGTHDPRYPVRSRFGTFKLPVRFHGRDIALIANGALLGR